MSNAFHEQGFTLAPEAPVVLLLGGRRDGHGADPRLAALERHQRAQERLAIEPAANASIIRQNDIIAQYKAALAAANAQDAALLAEVRVLKAALVKADPNNSLFRKTGRVYKSGAEQVALDLIFDQAFDESFIKDGFNNPENVRDSLSGLSPWLRQPQYMP
jgi:hypothetical protein